MADPYMLITRKKNICVENIKINNRIIEIVQFIRYLGVIIHNKHSFHNHVEYTVSKIAEK